jgi:hypothetical protein
MLTDADPNRKISHTHYALNTGNGKDCTAFKKKQGYVFLVKSPKVVWILHLSPQARPLFNSIWVHIVLIKSSLCQGSNSIAFYLPAIST